MTSRKFDDFDPFARNYREIHNRNIRISGADSYYFAEMKVDIVTANEPVDKASLLDIGCGDGACELFFHRSKPGWSFTGTDVSAESIKMAKSRNIPGSEFSLSDGKTLSFQDSEFDIVFVAGVLHHIHPSLHHEILQEAYRVMKPGARLYVFEHNPFNPLTRHLVNTCEFDKDAILLSSRKVKSALKKAGFNLKKQRFIIFFPRWKFLKWILPIERFLSKIPLGGQYYLVAEKPRIN